MRLVNEATTASAHYYTTTPNNTPLKPQPPCYSPLHSVPAVFQQEITPVARQEVRQLPWEPMHT